MKKSIKVFLLPIIIIILIYIILPKGSLTNLAIRQILVFYIIALISIIGLIEEFKNASYSLNIMHWIFVLFFFVIVPILHMAQKFYPWGIYQTKDELFKGSIYVLIWIIGYLLGSYFGKKMKINKKNSKHNKDYISKKKLLILTSISIICLAILVKGIGITNMFSRSTANISYSGENGKMIRLLINSCTRAVIVYCTSVIIISYQKSKKNLMLLIVNIIVLLLSCFPTALPRNTMATIYIGIAVTCFYSNIKKFRKSSKYIYTFLIAFIILFPAINTFRVRSFSGENIIKALSDATQNITKNYASEDYDAFSVIVETAKYVESNGSTKGKQLLGAMLFFIPRSIWNNKPYGSGQMVFTYLQKKFTNISSPLIAEGYINFGIIGIIIFSIIIGFIVSHVDKKYWKNISENSIQYDYLTILYPYMLASYFFMIRGDLLSTWSYMSAYIVVFWVMHKIIFTVGRNDNKEMID